MIQLIPDAHVRATALAPDRSFAVSAPAGSGKTGLLTQRVLRLLQTCDHPEELLAITFTRKAAGEMRDRITQALNQACTEACPEQPHDAKTWHLAQHVLARDEALNWQLLHNPNRLRIQTIDGLSRQLAKQLPFDSGMGSLPEPSDHPDPLYRAAVFSLFEKLESDDAIAEDIATILTELDNRYDTFETLLISLLKQRDQWLGLTLAAKHSSAKDYLEASLQGLISQELQQVLDVFLEHQLNLCELARYAAGNLLADEKDEPLSKLLDLTRLSENPTSAEHINHSLEQLKALSDLLLTKDGGWRKRLDKNMGFPTERAPEISKAEAKSWKDRLTLLIGELSLSPEFLDRLNTLRALPKANYQDNQWQLLSALTRLLPYLAAELSVVFSQAGCSDFIDTAQAALTALGNIDEPSELALKLDYHIRHILIDEFQDTSVPQRQLIELLTAGWEPNDGRTLFIVGDGMQSCYGFRNAKVGIFLQARQQGIGNINLEPLDLTVNFRSQAGVVAWINAHFESAFPVADNITRGDVSYQPSTAAKPALPEAVQLNLLVPQEESEAEIDITRAEADQVCALIQTLRNKNPQQTVALIARTRGHLREILKQLDSRHVLYQATELDNLSGRMSIQDLQALLRALLDPTDRISWLSLLRAPWCGLSNADLLAVVHSQRENLPAMADGHPSIWSQIQTPLAIEGISTEGLQILARVAAVVRETLHQRGRKPLRDWLEGCWLELGGQASLLDATDIANSQRFFDLLEAHTEAGGVRHWQDFEEAIARLYAAPSMDADPFLQVMTIHKSKGLEFDHVIIPGLHRNPRADAKELLLWLDQIDAEGQQQILLSPLSNFEQSDLYSYIQREKSARTKTEATRLFYVGATRAIRQLHLFACAKQKQGEIQAPSDNCLLASIWPSVKETANICYVDAASSNPAPAGSIPSGTHWIRRLPCAWQYIPPPACELLAAYRGNVHTPADGEQALNRPDMGSLFEADSRAVGTLLHACIQTLTQQGKIPDQPYLDAIRPLMQLQLKKAGVEHRAAAITKIERGLSTMAGSATGRWLLSNEHLDSATELEIWAPGPKNADGTRTPKLSILDRTFIDQGVRWVIDYKSAEPQVGQTNELFVLEQAELYRSQLAAYARLAAKLGREPVKTALYFPLCDLFEPIALE